ncbi:MAG: hypothetical protein JW804_00280 [Sedimentisphaerales bacterium]|nr:hypothetical protein [Sedimentisphaerales bacterium]
MSLIKWFRKNNRKLLAIAVVFLMVAFIGGPALTYLFRPKGGSLKSALARYGTKGTITHRDIMIAQRQLDILRKLGIPNMLRAQDISGILLGELLFTERTTSPRVIGALRNIIQSNQLRVTNQQILDMYNRDHREEIYWILLKKEVEQAGIAVNDEIAEDMLRRNIPRMFEGVSYAQLVNKIIQGGISEEEIISAFANIIAVHEYARIILSCEDLTLAQISKLASIKNESIDTEFVRMPAELFQDDSPRRSASQPDQTEPSEEELNEHFEKYKHYYQAQVSEENPYGFGYKFDNMVRLEYIAVKRADVEKLIEKPTQQDKEQYYSNNKYRFIEQVPIDPNDPNSPTTGRLKKFGEVAVQIDNLIRRDRIAEKIETILSKAKYLSEQKYSGVEHAELKGEKLKDLAADYTEIAGEISDTYSIKTYSGKTGLLSHRDIQEDKYLSRMFYQPATSDMISYPLVQFVLAVEELGLDDIVISNINKPKMYETISPVMDSLGQIAAVIRITEVQPSRVPETIDETVDKTTIKMDEDAEETEHEVFVIKEKATEELRLLAGQRQAGKKAEEFISFAEEKTWELALDKYNELYPPEPNEPNNFELVTLADLKKIGSEAMEVLSAQTKGFAGARLSKSQVKARMMIVNKLFSLVPAKSDTPEKLPLAVEMQPNMSYYCIKSLKMNRLDRDEYYKNKAISVYQRDFMECQNLAFEHFKPENILRRMNFRIVEQKKKPKDANEPAENYDVQPG